MTPDGQPFGPESRGEHTSASNAYADSLCPGRHLAQKGIPEPPESEDAKFGNQIHKALMLRDPAGLTAKQVDLYESCIKIEDKLIHEAFGPDKGKCAVFREKRFWVKVKGDAEGKVYYLHSGQPDVIYRLGNRGFIIDYKSLSGEVQVSAENMQLRDQVVLAAGNLILKEILAAPVQPLVTHSPVPVLYDATSIKQAEEDLFERVRKSNDPNSPRVAGKVQCEYCLAKLSCKEWAAWSTAIIPAKHSNDSFLSPVSEWTPEQRTVFCQQYKNVQTWLDDCTAQLKKLMEEDPKSVPGYHLKPGAIRSKITDPQELFNRFLALNGTQEKFLTCIDVVKSRLETEVKEATGAKGQALNETLRKLYDGIIQGKQNAPSIEEDK